jgi:hypothetical protein
MKNIRTLRDYAGSLWQRRPSSFAYRILKGGAS